MPELPEVEAVCLEIGPQVLNKKIVSVVVRNSKLRWPIPGNLSRILSGSCITKVWRRGKYILFDISSNLSSNLIIHLGMTGSLQIKPADHVFTKHEHLNIIFEDQSALCYTDSRRFGAVLWTDSNPIEHFLLKDLGPEPLDKQFDANYLFNIAKKRKVTVKQFIMDNKVVVGVGNIYANEALFAAKIHPLRKTNNLSIFDCKILTKKIKELLSSAIKHGGTTIKDFMNSHGQKGNFQDKLKVYGKQNQPCQNCATKLEAIRIGQRATVFCPHCQVLYPDIN